MKQTIIKIQKTLIMLFSIIALLISQQSFSQTKANTSTKSSIAVINIDVQGLNVDMKLVTSLVTLELERLDIYEVIDKYDVANHMNKNDIPNNKAYGKTELIRIGKLMNSQNVLSGSVEKFGNKIVIVLRLIGIKSGKIESVDVMEYIDQEENIQDMVRISLRNIFGLENDQNTVDMLSNFKPPITNNKAKLRLNGPRFGATMTFGNVGRILQAPTNQGGFDMFPISSSFGYQHEIQFISAGEFQALFEFVGMLTALESGYVIPSLSIINGFRFNKFGVEFGIGPVFRVVQTAEGYYDTNNNWILKRNSKSEIATYITQLDNRGDPQFSTGLIIAVGYTFKSGPINFPINIYVSPRKDGTVVGLLFGFNVARKRKSK